MTPGSFMPLGNFMTPWITRTLPHTDIEVGPCAWRLSMLAGPDRDTVKTHPSLIVVDPADSDDLLEQAEPHLNGLPVLLGVAEPTFARYLEDEVLRRMKLLGLTRVEALVLHVDDPAEIKSGGMLQTMFSLRDRGAVGHLGLAHPDATVAEWLAVNAAVRLLGVDYSLADQSAGHRALTAAAEHGMSVFALVSPGDEDAVRFSLAEAGRVLPVLDRPLGEGFKPMTPGEVDRAWENYRVAHPPPPALLRGRPPIAGG